jgi:N-acetylneuraminic acid mutarotase
MPSARSGHRMVYFEENLYIFGGYEEIKAGNAKYLNDFYLYNLKENKWTKDKRKIEKPSPRAGFCMWIREGYDLDDDEKCDEEDEEI